MSISTIPPRADGSTSVELLVSISRWLAAHPPKPGLEESLKAVHKTPDARSLQQRLEVFERIILLSQRLLTTDPVVFRKWLNTPPDGGAPEMPPTEVPETTLVGTGP